MRGIFAICVLLSHYSYPGTTDRAFYPGGASGVVYFLILSGFVMCASYANKINSSTFNYKEYLAKRAFRVLPLNWAALLGAVALAYGLFELPKLAIALNFFTLQAWVPDEELYYGFNIPSWTLGPIILFYILFPYIYRQLKSSPRRFLSVFVAVTLALLIVYYFLPDDSPITTWIVRLLPPVRLVEFIIGMLLYELYVLTNNSKMGEKLQGLSFAVKSIIELSLIGVWLGFLWLFHQVGERWTSSVIWWIPTGLLLFGIALFEKKGGCVTRLLHLRPLVYLGEVSFCIYLTHILTFKLVGRTCHFFGITPSMPYDLIVELVVCVIVGIIVFEMFDKPVNRYLRTRLIPAGDR